MIIFLETPRLVLRRFTEEDVDALVLLDSDPEVMAYISGGDPTPLEEIRDETLPALLAEYERGPVGRWAAHDRSTGAFAGWFALRPPSSGAAEEVELGYRLRREFWGRGLATEGSRAIIDKGFADLGVKRVYAETMAVNTASRRVMEKAGLTYVRTFYLEFDDPIDGTELGEVEYELLRATWAAARVTGATPG
ncbi:GNAT family N-acetyltransferase [Spirillospora sp. CA-294931]|uniref:GNAT family N-acetyltransferase n=1 Tax=Spirillospora sp. CA-294931 TaxID=3240042 RepID=UPI003D8C6165